MNLGGKLQAVGLQNPIEEVSKESDGVLQILDLGLLNVILQMKETCFLLYPGLYGTAVEISGRFAEV